MPAVVGQLLDHGVGEVDARRDGHPPPVGSATASLMGPWCQPAMVVAESPGSVAHHALDSRA